MKKILVGIGIVVAFALLAAFIWMWGQGKLFLRVPATISINGVEAAESAIYKSRTGEYFLLLDTGRSEHTTYWISEGKVGVPSDIVPSMGTLSFQSNNILICLDAEIDMLGEMSWEGVNPKLSMSNEEISFQVNDDNINIKFRGPKIVQPISHDRTDDVTVDIGGRSFFSGYLGPLAERTVVLSVVRSFSLAERRGHRGKRSL